MRWWRHIFCGVGGLLGDVRRDGGCVVGEGVLWMKGWRCWEVCEVFEVCF